MLDIGVAQTQGKRGYQEDAVNNLMYSSGLTLSVLSDGMGGAVHGEIASREILAAFLDSFRNSDDDDLAARLYTGVDRANRHLNDYIAQYPECDGMGGTLLATLYTGDRLDWVSVGDSPLWLVRNGEIRRINEDHSRKAQIQQLVQQGEMTEEQAANHPERNQVTSAVMGYEVALLDMNAIEARPGDLFLLASDGIESATETELLQLCQQFADADAQALAEQVIQYVDQLDRPYQDNATLAVLKVGQFDTDNEESAGA